MRWFEQDSLTGSHLEGRTALLVQWVAGLARCHGGFLPDVFPNHYYFRSGRVEGNATIRSIAFAQKTKRLGRNLPDYAVDFVFEVREENGIERLSIGINSGARFPVEQLCAVARQMQIAA